MRKLLRYGLPIALILLVAVIAMNRTPTPQSSTQSPSSIALPELQMPGDLKSDTQADSMPGFDAEMLALLPKNLPGHELGWLNGMWVRGEAMTNCNQAIGANLLVFSASQDGLYAITGPDPYSGPPISREFAGQAELPTEPKPSIVNGVAQVNPGENGFTYITPPQWENAYYRMKKASNDSLTAQLVIFDPDQTIWSVNDEFQLFQCPD